MRNKILSIVIACGVMVGAFVVYHVVSNDGDGQAFASSGASGNGAVYKNDKRAALRQTISQNPEHIIKLTGQHLRSVLDEPELVRRENPTTIWQYRSASCVLDVYFKTSKADATFAPVVHYEIRAREKGVRDADVEGTCLPALFRDKSAFKMVGVNSFYKALSE